MEQSHIEMDKLLLLIGYKVVYGKTRDVKDIRNSNVGGETA